MLKTRYMEPGIYDYETNIKICDEETLRKLFIYKVDNEVIFDPEGLPEVQAEICSLLYEMDDMYTNSVLGWVEPSVTVILPDGVQKISANKSYSGCNNFYRTINGIYVPKTVSNFEGDKFPNLTKIECAPSNKENLTFKNFGNTSLEEIKFPNNPVHIEEGCFSGTFLKRVKIPKGSIIDKAAFYRCTLLNDISVTGSTVSESAFSKCGSSAKVVLKDVPVIEDSAFRGTHIDKISFDSSLKEIDEYAFSRSGLKSIDFSNANIDKISEGAFEYSDIEHLILGNVKFVEKFAFHACEKLKSLAIAKSVETVDEYAFSDTPLLEKVYLESSAIKTDRFICDPFNSIKKVYVMDTNKHDNEFLKYHGANIEIVNLDFLIENGYGILEANSKINEIHNESGLEL